MHWRIKGLAFESQLCIFSTFLMKSPPFLTSFWSSKVSPIEPRMAEESRAGKKSVKPTITVANPSLSDMKAASSQASSVPSSPVTLKNSRSLRSNCLCSPTTHVGSFRCRQHRNSGLMRNSMSVGAKLSELGANVPVGPKLPGDAGQVAVMTRCSEQPRLS